MSHGYVAISWTPYKVRYDVALGTGVLAYVGTFVGVGMFSHRAPHEISPEVLTLRALGTCAFAMLTIILTLGPLARLDRRFLPLVYNRRHFGVVTFAVGLAHGLFASGYYHGFGVLSAPISLLTANTAYRSISGFPFEILGVLALVILFLMAATSHDFWLKNLTPRVWKGLHMGVYVAWSLLIMHVALGALQSEPSHAYATLLWAVAVIVPALHLVAGFRERDLPGPMPIEWLDVCALDDLPLNRGHIAKVPGLERIALFRDETGVHAISNVCAHQGGPLGEGRILSGCVTCPWHGFQYEAKNGRAPAPFTEKVPTYRLRVIDGRVQVDPTALPPGTETEPAHA